VKGIHLHLAKTRKILMARSKKVNAVPVISSAFVAENKKLVADIRKKVASSATLADNLHGQGVRAEMLYSPKGKPERAAFAGLYNSFTALVRAGFSVADQKLMAEPVKGMTDARKAEKNALLVAVGAVQNDIRSALKRREAKDAPKAKQQRQPHQKTKIKPAPSAPTTKHGKKGEKQVLGIIQWVHTTGMEIAKAVEAYSGTEITTEQREELVKLAKQLAGYIKE
jgi:hypothetical protein